jgi:hypothetical protein
MLGRKLQELSTPNLLVGAELGRMEQLKVAKRGSDAVEDT